MRDETEVSMAVSKMREYMMPVRIIVETIPAMKICGWTRGSAETDTWGIGIGEVCWGVDDDERVRRWDGSSRGAMGDAIDPRFRCEGWNSGGVEGVVVISG